MSLQNYLGIGVMGSMISLINTNYSSAPSSPTSMDLKIYGRLFQRLAVVNN